MNALIADSAGGIGSFPGRLRLALPAMALVFVAVVWGLHSSATELQAAPDDTVALAAACLQDMRLQVLLVLLTSVILAMRDRSGPMLLLLISTAGSMILGLTVQLGAYGAGNISSAASVLAFSVALYGGLALALFWKSSPQIRATVAVIGGAILLTLIAAGGRAMPISEVIFALVLGAGWLRLAVSASRASL